MQMLKMSDKRSKKAITPIIATVLIIAVTLVAGVAIAGYVFGLFGSGTQTAQVQVLNTAVPAATVNSTLGTGGPLLNGTSTISIMCDNTANHRVFTNAATLQFSNTGVANTKVIGITLTFGGVTYSVSFSGTAPEVGCSINSASSLTMYLNGVKVASGVTMTAGAQFVGSITLSSGAQIPFTGAFL